MSTINASMLQKQPRRDYDYRDRMLEGEEEKQKRVEERRIRQEERAEDKERREEERHRSDRMMQILMVVVLGPCGNERLKAEGDSGRREGVGGGVGRSGSGRTGRLNLDDTTVVENWRDDVVFDICETWVLFKILVSRPTRSRVLC